MRLDRSRTALRSIKENDNGYVNAPPNECISLVWEITREVWSFKGDSSAERRLQRTVTNLFREKR